MKEMVSGYSLVTQQNKTIYMNDVVFQVFRVFYTKPAKQRRKAIKAMLKWCIKEYINTFKKDEPPLTVVTDKITNI